MEAGKNAINKRTNQLFQGRRAGHLEEDAAAWAVQTVRGWLSESLRATDEVGLNVNGAYTRCPAAFAYSWSWKPWRVYDGDDTFWRQPASRPWLTTW